LPNGGERATGAVGFGLRVMGTTRSAKIGYHMDCIEICIKAPPSAFFLLSFLPSFSQQRTLNTTAAIHPEDHKDDKDPRAIGSKDHSTKGTTIEARISKNTTRLVGREGFGSGNVEGWVKMRNGWSGEMWGKVKSRNSEGQRGISFNSYDDNSRYAPTRFI